jgi:hypothetical protein
MDSAASEKAFLRAESASGKYPIKPWLKDLTYDSEMEDVSFWRDEARKGVDRKTLSEKEEEGEHRLIP